MNNESLNEHLVTESMGYQICENGKYFRVDSYSVWLPINQWNPCENIKQAMMCLDTFADYDYGKKIGLNNCVYYYCRILILDNNLVYEESDKSKEIAISLACAKATGWVDD